MMMVALALTASLLPAAWNGPPDPSDMSPPAGGYVTIQPIDPYDPDTPPDPPSWGLDSPWSGEARQEQWELEQIERMREYMDEMQREENGW